MAMVAGEVEAVLLLVIFLFILALISVIKMSRVWI